MASSLPSSSTHFHLRALQAGGGGHRQVDDVRWLLVDRDEHVDAHPAARSAPLPYALVGDRPPEAERLHQVEELRRDQDAVEVGGADAVRVEQPAEVPHGGGHSEQDQEAHPPAHAPARGHGFPCDPPQADVPGPLPWNPDERL
jgi:hypothetical protein